MASISTLTLVAALCLVLAAPLLVWSFTTRSGSMRRQTLGNLQRDFTVSSDREPSVVQGGGIVAIARVATPPALVRGLDRALGKAGRPQAWPLERVLVSKLVLGCAVGALMCVLWIGNRTALMMLIAVVSTGIAWLLPEILLYNHGTKRRKEVQDTLPDLLDQLTISVEAGLGFESALARVSRNTPGALSDEFIRTLQDIQVGQSRRVAYANLAERVPVADLRRFLRSIIQADEHGISIARILSTQAREMRMKRRQRAEEKAMKLPVKILFPLILFILPVLMIVVLGPAIINIIEQFSGGGPF